MNFDKNSLWGLVLIGFGGLFLAGNFFNVGDVGGLIIGLLFLLGSGAFVMTFLSDRNRWWAAFPAFMLGFIGIAIITDEVWFLRRLDMGPLFLGGLGAAFAFVFVRNQSRVWPVIPGGFFLTLAAVSMTPWFINDGLVFFGGLAATWVATYVLSHRTGERWTWALIPAAGCALVMALIVTGIVLKYLLPIGLVAAGVYLLYHNTKKQQS